MRSIVFYWWILALAGLASAQTCRPEGPLAPAPTQVFSPAGGSWTGQFTLTAVGCTWNLTADVPWIKFSSTVSGTVFSSRQAVTVFGSVAGNTESAPLHATITLTEGDVVVQRYPIIVTSDSCSYTVDPPSAQFGKQGGSGQFTLTAAPPDCFPFDPTASSYGISLGSVAASHSQGIFYYGIPPNFGTAISATATLSTRPLATFTVIQDGGDGTLQAGCPISNVARTGSNIPVKCTAVGGMPPYTWSLTSGAYPEGIAADSFPNKTLTFNGALLREGLYSFVETVTDSSSPPQVASVTVSGVVLPPKVSMNCSVPLGPPLVGAFYFEACEPKGGSGSYQWSISAGALPDGFSISPGPAGGIIISGSPTVSKPYYYVLQVSDTSTPVPSSAVKAFSGLPLSSAPPLSINCSGQSPTVSTGVFISQFSCSASGGTGVYQYSISSGSLPPGLTITNPSGTPLSIFGSPTTPGEFKFTIQVSDSSQPPQTAEQSFDISVIPPLAVTCTPSAGPTRVGQSYTSTCTASGGQPPYNMSVSPLPEGLTFAQTGPATVVVSGTPTQSNPYSYNVSVADSAPHSAGITVSGFIEPNTGAPRVRLTCDAALTGAEVGVPIAPIHCVAAGGTPPYKWQAPNGLLGLSLTIAGTTATLSGTPTTSGSFFGLSVTDSSSPQVQGANWSPSAFVSQRLSMSCDPVTGPTSIGQVFSSSCSVSSGVPPLSWSSSGTLPPGVNFFSSNLGSTATIHGSPMAGGPYNFTVTIRDSASTPVTISQTFSGTISPVGAAVLIECLSSAGKYVGGVAITPTTCSASGGTPPYQWSISNGSLPLGLSLGPVTGGMAITGIPTIAGTYTYSITVSDQNGQTALWPVSAIVSNPYTPLGPSALVLPHLAFGGGWQSRIVLLSNYSLDTANLRFYGESGNPIGVPYKDVATGSGSTASFIDQRMPPNGAVFIDTAGAASDQITNGYAQLYSVYSAITGFGVFSYPSLNWQALVPIDTVRDKSYVVAFDNTGSLATGVAIASTDSSPIDVSAVVSDDNGAVLQTATIPLGAGAHISFLLNQQFSATAGRRGTVRFTAPSFGSIHVLAIRTNGPALTTLPVLGGSIDNPGGFIAHVTYNGGFTSTIFLVNTAATSAEFTLKFFDENGGALNVPLLLPQSGTTTTTSALTKTLAAGAMLVVKTQSNSSLAGVVGSAQLLSGAVGGFEIFEWTAYGQEASVPLQSQSSSAGVGRRLVFDNTGGFATGVAVSNPSTLAGNITVNIRDEGGNLLQTSTIKLPANGHTSFMLPSAYPVTNGIRGSVEFVAQFFQPNVIGLRAGPGGTLTTIPAL